MIISVLAYAFMCVRARVSVPKNANYCSQLRINKVINVH